MISGAVWPLLVRLSEDMNAQRRGVVQRWYGEQYRVEFKDIRPEDKEGKRAELTAYQPFYTLNELRELTGQEALDDPRGLMLVAEINKGAPLPGTPAAKLLEALQAEKEEAEAQEQAELIEQGVIPDPTMEPEEGEGLPPPQEAAPEMKATWRVPDAIRALAAAHPEDETLNGDGTPTPTGIIQQDDRLLWERKALKSWRRFRKADVSFETNAIPLPEQVEIHAALKAATDVPSIKAAFRGVDALMDAVDGDARKWVEEAEGDE